MITQIVCITLVAVVFGKDIDEKASKIVSDYILSGLKKDSKPCENAFDFVCGKWFDNLPDQNETFYYYEENWLQNQTKKVLLEALKSIDVADKSTPMYKIWVRTFYDQCLVSNISKTDSVKQIFNGLQRVIGPPPLMTMNKTVHDILVNRNIWNLLGQLQRKLATGVFFKTTVDNTNNDCDKTIPILSLEPQSLYTLDQEMNATEIKSSITFMAGLLAVTVDDAELDKKIKMMIDLNDEFVQFLNQTETDEYYDYFSDYQLINSTELASVNQKIDWQEFFKGLFADQFTDWDQSQAKFRMRDKKSFKKIDTLITKYDVETIFNYMFYKTMKELTEILTALDSDFAENPVESCIKSVISGFSPAAAKLYFDFTKQNPLDWQSDLIIIADNVRTSLKQLVTKTQWLSPLEMARVLDKINHMEYPSKIPDFLISDEAVQNRTVKFDADKGVHDNAVNIAKWTFRMELNRLLTGDTSDVAIYFYTGSSYFDMEISSYFGTTLPPFYHFNYPLAVKYALFGNAIGSSLMQRFGGMNYFGDRSSWLNDSNAIKFDEQISCIDNQITQLDCKDSSDRCPTERSWTWNSTLNRISREIDGFSIAYNAYKMATQEAEPNQLPGLTDYNWDQIFLISYGRSLCHTYLQDDYEEGGRNASLNHIVKLFRNIPMYGKSFQCPQNGKMSVEKPCGLWNNLK